MSREEIKIDDRLDLRNNFSFLAFVTFHIAIPTPDTASHFFVGYQTRSQSQRITFAVIKKGFVCIYVRITLLNRVKELGRQ